MALVCGACRGGLGEFAVDREVRLMPDVTQVPREPLLLADFVLDDQYLHFPLR